MKYLEERFYELPKRKEYIEIILITIGILMTPILLPSLIKLLFSEFPVVIVNTQYIVGSIINASLIVAGINVRGFKKIIALITLPSIYAMSSGLILGSSSIFTVYMIPFIWIGNFTLIYLYKYLFVSKKISYTITSLVSVLAKAAIIFAGFNLLILLTSLDQNNMLLNAMTLAMGINQVITGTIGSVIAFTIIKLFYKGKENKLNA